MTTYTFRKEEFSSLGFTEYLGNWTPIGLDDLSSAEGDSLLLFLNYLGDLEQVDTTNLLLVKAAEGGILKDVYGPCVFKKDDQLVLKVGVNEFPVTQKGSQLEIGRLAGGLSFENDSVKVRVKDSEKNEYEVEIYNATVDLMPNPIPENDSEFFEFRARIAWDAANCPNKSVIKAKMARGESLAQFVSEVPSGQGGNTLKMQDLGEGEFAVTGCKTITGGQYGDSYILELADGRSVWSRGTVAQILKTGWKIPPGQPCTLQIANIKQKSDGKYQLDCALRMREPRNTKEDHSVPPAPDVMGERLQAARLENRTRDFGAKDLSQNSLRNTPRSIPAQGQPVSNPATAAVATLPIEESPDIDEIPW